ncbi:hypothetical protein [Ramlibacter sp.]|uniref:hypothetical protein n=1 Tax=Ramlibacter sp. TaxID=1917967 RepID=UPI00260355F6|nr:hypothetical protein [Ramlibacter sp.]MDB5953469.1 hypothetical protein [Ramlibacter sp.]
MKNYSFLGEMSHYGLLGVACDASAEEIEAVYQTRVAALPRGALARVLWAVYSGENETTLAQARRVLCSPTARAAYDCGAAVERPPWHFYPGI